MDKKKKAFFNLIISALLLCSALTVAVTSFGWFARNDTVNGSGMGAVIKTEDGGNILAVEYFNVSSDTAYEYTNTATSGETPGLGKYNLLNDKYQMLVKVFLNTANAVTLTASTSTSYYLGSDEAFQLLPAETDDVNTPQTSSATVNGETIEYTNALSSVVSFAFVENSDLTAITNGFSLSALPTESSFKTFVDKDANAIKSSVTICSAVTPVADTTSDGESGYSVAILFSYDEEQMSKVFSMNVANSLFTQATTEVSIPFLCDFSVSIS